jgi:L-rhamnose mutarotase
MQRYAQVIQLRTEYEAEYIRVHADVWPAVLSTIAACNIRNYSIFLHGGVLFAYFEYQGTDYAADMRRMAECRDTQRWWGITDAMQLTLPDALEGEKWSPLREVFHFEGAIQVERLMPEPGSAADPSLPAEVHRRTASLFPPQTSQRVK